MSGIKEIIRVLGFIQEYFDNHADEQEPNKRKELFVNWSDTVLEAITLLKAQEPRVMTLEEALGGDECWVEYSNGGCGYADCYLSYTTNGADIYRMMQHDFNVPLATYGKTWRCWTSRPDQATKEAIPWN